MITNFGHRRHFDRRPRKEHLLRLRELFRLDMPFDDFNTALFCQFHDGSFGNSVEETIRIRGVQFAVRHQHENISASRFRDITAVIQHQRIGKTFCFRVVLRERTDHIEPRRLSLTRDRRRIGTAPLRPFHTDTLHPGFRREIGGPIPCGHRDVNPGLLRRHTHHAGASPGNRTQITVRDTVFFDQPLAGGINFVRGIWNLEIHDPGAFEKPFRVLAEFENLTTITALTLEDSRRIVHGMAQDMHVCLFPRHHFPVEPNHSWTVVEGFIIHLTRSCTVPR